MKREQLLRSPHYWMTYIQNGLFKMIENYRFVNRLKKKDLADKLGVTKGYVSQLLNGDFDHKISKLVELSLACGKVPQISYSDLEQYIKADLNNEIAIMSKNQAASNIQNILILHSDNSMAFTDEITKLIRDNPFQRFSSNLLSLENSETASVSTKPFIENEYSRHKS